MSESEGLRPGSPEWRDARDRELTGLLEHPEAWNFLVTDEQSAYVKEAYSRFRELDPQTYPDPSGIRMMISNTKFDRPDSEHQLSESGGHGDGPLTDLPSMTKWWNTFVSDMPDVFQKHKGIVELTALWVTEKVKAILRANSLPFLTYEERELGAHLRAPHTLSAAAAALTTAEADGYSLYHVEVNGDRVTWSLKRGKLVTYEKEGVSPS